MYSQDIDEILHRIENCEVGVCVIGVGTIGLPLATFLAHKGFSVRGLDISQKRVDEINSAAVVYEYREILEKVRADEKLKAMTDPKEALTGVEMIFVCVPTPLNKNNEMDISNLYNVANKIAPFIKSGMILIFESSVSIGTTKEIANHIEKLTGFKFGRDLGLAYCPERYNPSPMKKSKIDSEYNIVAKGENFPLDRISRVVGGVDEKSTKIAKAIYSSFITNGVSEVSTIEAAEATKLLENIFRDVNIALVNELAKIMPKFGLDIFEIIDAAKTKPFAFMPHYPGAGVGGECIPVDTWYLISQARKIGIETKLMRMAREVNDSMPDHMIQLLSAKLHEFGKEIKNSNITILGLCYKKNVPDIRLSPTFVIIEKLNNMNANLIVCDPVYANMPCPVSLTSPVESFKNSDAVLLVTDHDAFTSIEFKDVRNQMRTPIVIDGRNFFAKKDLTRLGFSYVAIGKP